MIKKFFKLDRLIPAFLAIILSSFLATAATPGVQRSYLPKLYGIHQIDQNIFTDSTTDQDKIKNLVKKARVNTQQFYGDLRSNPQFIICTTKRCKNQLGFKSRGIAYGFSYINIGPKGVNETILTHELLHAELHKRLGYIGLLKQTIPAWFNEGLATHLSNDKRLSKNHSAKDITWIKGAKYRKDWSKFASKNGWKRAYGSAAQAVKKIEDEIGQKGIRTIISRVAENGEDFDRVLADLGV